MNCWEILELEPTSDKKKVEQAYEAKLKMINVEEEPLAFQKLKEAFDSAIFLSGTIIESNRPVELSKPSIEADTAVESNTKGWPVEESQEVPSENEKPKQENNVMVFEQELATVYEKMDFFSDVEKWTPLFSNELEWTSAEHDEIAEIIQTLLRSNYRVLSRQNIDYLDTFCDVDFLAKEHKSDNDFRYIWTQIKHVPPFSFDIYQDIPKEERIEYFTNRYELFQIVEGAVPNQSSWSERLHMCRTLTTKDYDVITLQISYLLLNDFRMEQEQTVIEFKGLLSEAIALKSNKTSDFFSAYYAWVKQKGSTNDVLIYDKSELTIPTTTIDLLMGYVYFKLRRYSHVKKCWEELSKKNPTLFRPQELAMLQPIDVKYVPQKNQKSMWRYVGAVFLLLIALSKISGLVSRNNERNWYSSLSDIQNSFNEENNLETNNVTADLLELKESENLYEQFIYYFYIDREDEDRASFIEANTVGQAKEMAQSMTVSELPEIMIDSRYDFYASPDNVTGYGPVTALTLLDEDEPFIILQEDKEERISAIFGDGWEVLAKDKFKALWSDIQVRPMMSQKFFVVYYLLSDERNENLKDNPEYATENVKILLEKNRSMPIAKEFEAGTWQISQDEEDKLYTIINDKNDEHRFILSYDEYGRLEHIYGDEWETIDDTKKKTIYDNVEEEKIGVY
ncbi:hypothetical protein JZO86_11655 [Enterococcus ureasiticus]|uniref:hypothetical protein n=1 Tax=Enterococcus ureasiticus TaxID=903984 RepID=UPI001A9014BD|nr:hypothetical protein [Enterococcus ureasiticus]MBO0474355.1 hypothetical protein [Enterococcus ureasiticus]